MTPLKYLDPQYNKVNLEFRLPMSVIRDCRDTTDRMIFIQERWKEAGLPMSTFYISTITAYHSPQKECYTVLMTCEKYRLPIVPNYSY